MTMATMVAFSFLDWARPMKVNPPYPITTHGLDKSPDQSWKYPEPRRDSYLVTRDQSNSTQIQITIRNRRENPVYTYVTGVNPQNSEYFMLYNEGRGNFKWEVKPSGNESNNANANYFTESKSNYEILVNANNSRSFYIPTYAAGGRIYIADKALRFGTNQGGPTMGFVEPSPSNTELPEFSYPWQFIEFTWIQDQFWINLSNMDLVSIPLGMTVTSKNTGNSVQTVPGLVSNATALICEALTNQTTTDGYNWRDLCIRDENYRLIRVLSPDQFLSMNATDPLNKYYDKYVDAVWERYNKMNLTIQTQDSNSQATNANDADKGIKSSPGNQVSCRVGDDKILHCYNPASGKSYVFPKPTTKEIFGCTQDGNTFQVMPDNTADWTQAEIVPRLCAAFHRSTLLRDGGNIQPYVNGTNTAEDYYCNNDATNQSCIGGTTNHYARIVHEYETEGMGYAFAYDDTNPIAEGLNNASANAAGLISDPNPASVVITVGW